MSAPEQQPHTSIPFLNEAPLTEDNAFSRQSPFYTMFIHTGNNRMLDQFKSDGSLEEDFKIQTIVLYGGFRLTEILNAGMRYARVGDVKESMRRLTWIQVGLLHELCYFLSHVGLAAASGWSNKLDIPPIITYLSSAFGIATKEDLPVSIDDRLFDHPLFSSWITNCGGWASPWWLDPDFNMDRPADPLNKTSFLNDDNLLEALQRFWNSYEAIKISEHAAMTEAHHPHSSKRSQWRMPKTFVTRGTCLTTSWDNWTDMYVGLRGRRWANPDPTQPPYPGIDILGWADNDFHREENYRRYEGQNIPHMLTRLRTELAYEGLRSQRWYHAPEGEQPGVNDPSRPDLDRIRVLPPLVNEPLQLAGAQSPLGEPGPEASAPSASLSAWRTASAVRRPSTGKAREIPPAGSASAGPLKKIKPTQGTSTSTSHRDVSLEPNWANTVEFGPERLKQAVNNVEDDEDMEDSEESDAGFALALGTGHQAAKSEQPIILGSDDDDDDESDGGLAAAIAGTSIDPIVIHESDSESDGGFGDAVAASMQTAGRSGPTKGTGNSEHADDEDEEDDEDDEEKGEKKGTGSGDEISEDEADNNEGFGRPAAPMVYGDIEMKDTTEDDDEEEDDDDEDEDDELRQAVLRK